VEYYHNNLLPGHCGVQKTLKILQERLKLQNMKAFVMKYITSCNVCLRVKTRQQIMQGTLALRKPTRGWEEMAMDLTKCSESRTGNKHIFSVADPFSRQCVLTPIPDKSAKTIGEALIKNAILKYGKVPCI